MDYKFDYAYFDVRDGNSMTLEERIQEALKLLQNENDCILFEDGKKCKNEHELRQILEEAGIVSRMRQKSILKYALWGVIFCGIIYYNNHSEESSNALYGEEQSYKESSSANESKINNQPKQSITGFTLPRDVRRYLSTHRFSSNNGSVLSFKDGGHSLYLQDRCISTNVEIVKYHDSGALLEAVGPYGKSSLMIVLADYGNSIVDLNDNTVYEEL